jgi:hypothetical protein
MGTAHSVRHIDTLESTNPRLRCSILIGWLLRGIGRPYVEGSDRRPPDAPQEPDTRVPFRDVVVDAQIAIAGV